MTTATPNSARHPAAGVLRPAAERFHSQLDWLDSWHTFSFSSHFDPAWMGFGPLRVINDDVIAAGQGFGMHPHRDMEIITVMVEGELHHRDSMGHAEVLRAGEVQRMSAGTGVVHSEINGGSSACRLLQIWIEPASTGIAPAYEQKPFVLAESWRLLIDPNAADGAMAIHRPVRLWRANVAAGTQLEWPATSSCSSWIQIINGSLIEPRPLRRGDGLALDAEQAPPFLQAGSEGVDLLVFELR